MKRFFAAALAMALVGTAQAKPPRERVVLLVGNTPQAQQQAAGITERLVGQGPFEVIEADSKKGATYRSKPEATHLIRLVGDKIVWQRALVDGNQAWSDFQAIRYDVTEGSLLGWTHVEPQNPDGPLRRDEIVEFYAGGLPGLQVSTTLGGQSVELLEESPGFYTGAYRVAPDDRVDAKISFSAQDGEGLEELREAGEISLQGLEPPKLTGLGQATARDWILQGEASPGTRVEISIAIRIGGLFGARTKRRSVEALANEDGQFEAVATLGTLTSSPKGIVKVKSIDPNGVEMLGPEQEVRFRSRVVYRYDPWGYGAGWGRGPFIGRGFNRGRCW